MLPKKDISAEVAEVAELHTTIEPPKEIKFIKGPLKIKTEKACLCARECSIKVNGQVRCFFSPMIYVPVQGVEFYEKGVQFVRIVEGPELEAWLSSLQGEQALYIRGPHDYIVSSALQDKGAIIIEPI